ncbi:MAG: hypothetical protein J0H30_00595 [Alphaproteobacteria bacterium]|nr:hypothetical protein [Alphaproteobacteria bacterium]
MAVAAGIDAVDIKADILFESEVLGARADAADIDLVGAAGGLNREVPDIFRPRFLPLTTDMEIGTSCTFSTRFWAVTSTVSISCACAAPSGATDNNVAADR